MPPRPFPKLLIFSLIVIFIVQAFAVTYYWYWRMRWFDIPMHFVGGSWLAGVAIWWRFFRADSLGDNVNPRGFLVLVLWGVGVAFIVGALWEIYESIVSFLTVGHINDIIDTVGDLVFDVLGGLVSVIYVYTRMRENGQKTE